jgi:hypothetical protein
MFFTGFAKKGRHFLNLYRVLQIGFGLLPNAGTVL